MNKENVLKSQTLFPPQLNETKGCQLFCHGLVQQPQSGNFCVLCVAIKRTVQVYEVNKTRQRYRKMKDIQVSHCSKQRG